MTMESQVLATVARSTNDPQTPNGDPRASPGSPEFKVKEVPSSPLWHLLKPTHLPQAMQLGGSTPLSAGRSFEGASSIHRSD